MLHVDYKLDKDSYGGIGLFAAQSIKKGQLIFSYDRDFVHIFTIHDLNNMSEATIKALQKFGYGGKGRYKLEGAFYFDIDDSRFMNHSDTPSLVHVIEDNSYIAAHDMEVGDEITCNYSEIGYENIEF